MREFSGKVSSAHNKPLEDTVENLENQLYKMAKKEEQLRKLLRRAAKRLGKLEKWNTKLLNELTKELDI